MTCDEPTVINYLLLFTVRLHLLRQYDTKQLLLTLTHLKVMLRWGVRKSSINVEKGRKLTRVQLHAYEHWCGEEMANFRLKPSGDYSYYDSWQQFVYFHYNSNRNTQQACWPWEMLQTASQPKYINQNQWITSLLMNIWRKQPCRFDRQHKKNGVKSQFCFSSLLRLHLPKSCIFIKAKIISCLINEEKHERYHFWLPI